ncbi:Isthmin-2 [Liparis tanakae]|uniref:Isthmin-2 n=1 Tax=Liparis tanakae TaxID=230148 RepID=A0A4Z2E473_9TELE|nr:Isthmin-2 [Liparis tanakae]
MGKAAHCHACGTRVQRTLEVQEVNATRSEPDADEWTPWTPCSATCGSGEKKRTKSCGYSCTLTEASKCDLQPCPGDDNAVVEPFPFELENGTEPFGTGEFFGPFNPFTASCCIDRTIHHLPPRPARCMLGDLRQHAVSEEGAHMFTDARQRIQSGSLGLFQASSDLRI